MSMPEQSRQQDAAENYQLGAQTRHMKKCGRLGGQRTVEHKADCPAGRDAVVAVFSPSRYRNGRVIGPILPKKECWRADCFGANDNAARRANLHIKTSPQKRHI